MCSVQEGRDPEPWLLTRDLGQMMRERLPGLLLLPLKAINPWGGTQTRADLLSSPRVQVGNRAAKTERVLSGWVFSTWSLFWLMNNSIFLLNNRCRWWLLRGRAGRGLGVGGRLRESAQSELGVVWGLENWQR